MTSVPYLEKLKPVLDQVAVLWGFSSFLPVLLQNHEYCDQLLCCIEGDNQLSLSDAVRKEVYAAFIGPGPGGVRAFAWLLEHGELDRTLVSDYLDCLQAGPSRRDGILEEDVQRLVTALLEHWQGDNEDVMLKGLCQLLNCNALSSKARGAGLNMALGDFGLPPGLRTRLAHWACHSNHNDGHLPLAHSELVRSGFSHCARLGEPPQQVLSEALRQASQDNEMAGQAALELLEQYPGEIDPQTQQETLQLLKDSQTSALRRRAFQLLEKKEGADWIHRGLRDRDASVRSWALQRLNAQRTA